MKCKIPPRGKALFNAKQFTQTKGTTAIQKAKFANDYAAFVLNDFPRHKFTKAFYATLHGTFSHMAHGSLEGFYNHWFCSTERKLQFINNALRHWAVGDPAFTFSDVESALKVWLMEQGIEHVYAAQLENEIEKVERAELARLKAKYE